MTEAIMGQNEIDDEQRSAVPSAVDQKVWKMT